MTPNPRKLRAIAGALRIRDYELELAQGDMTRQQQKLKAIQTSISSHRAHVAGICEWIRRAGVEGDVLDPVNLADAGRYLAILEVRGSDMSEREREAKDSVDACAQDVMRRVAESRSLKRLANRERVLAQRAHEGKMHEINIDVDASRRTAASESIVEENSWR